MLYIFSFIRQMTAKKSLKIKTRKQRHKYRSNYWQLF